MALIVTPGGTDAEAYWPIADIALYAASRGKSFPVTGAPAIAAAEAAARRGASWIDGTYRDRFPGSPTSAGQALEWPRTGATYRGTEWPDDTIPMRIKQASAEAAIRELASPGSLSPDLKRGGLIKAVGAGSARVEFMDGASAATAFQEIDAILAPLLTAATGATVDLLRV